MQRKCLIIRHGKQPVTKVRAVGRAGAGGQESRLGPILSFPVCRSFGTSLLWKASGKVEFLKRCYSQTLNWELLRVESLLDCVRCPVRGAGGLRVR